MATDLQESELRPRTVRAPDPGVRGRGGITRWANPRSIILTVVVVVIAYLALVPLVYLVWGTLFDSQGFTLDAFVRAYSAYGLGSLTTNTLYFSAGATIVSLVAGTGLAYLTERTDVPFKSLIFSIALIPLIIPGILYTISWIFLAGPRTGVISVALQSVFGTNFGMDVFTIPGMIVVSGLDNAPLAFLLMVATFRSMDPSLEESALMSGATLPQVLRRVTLPLGLPGLLGAALITMVRNIESFETPALLGMPSDIWVFTTRIWQVLSRYPADYGQAGAYALTLLVITSLVVFLQSRLTRGQSRYQTVTGKGFRPRRMHLGRWRWVITSIVVLYSFVAIVLPVLMLVFMSVQPFNRPPTWENIAASTIDNYAYVLGQPQTLRALFNSFLLGFGTATGVMVLVAIAAWIVVRTKVRGRWILDNLTFLPIVIPGLVLGVALLFMYLRSPIPVYATLWILLIAYMTRFMPYGMRYAVASMYQIADELEESGYMSGASWGQVFRRIILPLLTPGFLAGWIYVLMVAFRELSASLLLYSSGSEVLSIRIWQMWTNGESNELAALGVIMIACMVVIVIIAQKLGARLGYQAG